MTIKEFKQWWNRFEYSGNFPEPKVEHINLLLAEIERLDRVFHNQGNLREQIFDLQLEITRLNDLIGNTRLADQEAIERHVTKRVAGEIMAEIDDLDTETDADFYLCGYIAANFLRYRIRKKYGVE